MNPLDLPGSDYLEIYAVGLAAAGLSARYLVHRWARRPGDLPAGLDADTLSGPELAYLAGGPRRAAEAAVAGLLHAGLVELRDGRIASTGAAPAQVLIAEGAYRGSVVDAAMDPITAAVLSRVRLASARLVDLSQLIAEGAALTARLRELGLVREHGDGPRFAAAAPLVLWALFGATKIVVGLERGRPVGFLVLLVAVTAIAAVWAARIPLRTRRADRLLAERRRDLTGLRATASSAPAQLSAPEHSIAYALFGAVVLLGPSAALAAEVQSSAAGWLGGGSSGCSSGCGGGGDGCGGGCGGCS